MTKIRSNILAALKNPNFDFFFFSFFKFDSQRSELLRKRELKEHFTGLVQVLFVFRVRRLMRSIQCTDKSDGIRILKLNTKS